MADSYRSKVLYKPDLKPERYYESEAQFKRETPYIPLSSHELPPKDLDELLNEYTDMEELAPGFPSGLDFVGESIVKPIKQRIAVMITEGTPYDSTVHGGDDTYGWTEPTVSTSVPIDKRKFKDPEFNIGSSTLPGEYDIEGLPDLFAPSSNVTITLDTPKTIVSLVNDAYKKDQIDLQKYYLRRMKQILQHYFQSMLALMADLSLGEIDYLTAEYYPEVITGVTNNTRHLHDLIIRSQIGRQEKIRYFEKVASIDQTLMHMRVLHTAEESRERYYAEAYDDSTYYIESMANTLLRQSRAEYDFKYNSALLNFYKYLDASIQITEDVLDDTLREAIAKSKLIKEGVNVFARPEVVIKGTTNVTEEGIAAAQESSIISIEDTVTSSTNVIMNEKDKAAGITDPAPEIAPNGGHYSENDIQWLMTEEGGSYTREAAVSVLSQIGKYNDSPTWSTTETTERDVSVTIGSVEHNIENVSLSGNIEGLNNVKNDSKSVVEAVISSEDKNNKPKDAQEVNIGDPPVVVMFNSSFNMWYNKGFAYLVPGSNQYGTFNFGKDKNGVWVSTYSSPEKKYHCYSVSDIDTKAFPSIAKGSSEYFDKKVALLKERFVDYAQLCANLPLK